MLVEFGADVNARKDDNTTPLHEAVNNARFGSTVIRMLLEHGANVGAQDIRGRTALQIASEWEEDEIMALLSEHGAT